MHLWWNSSKPWWLRFTLLCDLKYNYYTQGTVKYWTISRHVEANKFCSRAAYIAPHRVFSTERHPRGHFITRWATVEGTRFYLPYADPKGHLCSISFQLSGTMGLIIHQCFHSFVFSHDGGYSSVETVSRVLQRGISLVTDSILFLTKFQAVA